MNRVSRPSRWSFFSLVLCCSLVGLGCSGCSRGEKKTLRCRFQPGQKFRCTRELTIDVTTPSLNPPIQMTSKRTDDTDWKVVSVGEDGTAELHRTIQRVKIDFHDKGGKSFSYDSASEKEPVGEARRWASVGRQVGARSSWKINSRGKVLDHQVLDGPVLFDDPGDPLAAWDLGNTRRNWAQQLSQLPEEAVRKGDTWTHTAKVMSPRGPLTATLNFTQEGATSHEGRQVQKISYRGTLELAQTLGNTAVHPGVEFKDVEGTTLFDANAGRPVQSEARVTVLATDRIKGVALQSQTTITERITWNYDD